MRQKTSELDPKPQMFLAVTTTWMLSAVACAALPFVHALPRLKAAGQIAPLLVSLVIGAAVAVPLSLAARCVCGLGSDGGSWSSFAPRSAAVLGTIGWGVPVGLMFALNEFLTSSSVFVALPAVVIWPLGGIVFGLTMRKLGHRNAR